MSDQPVLRLLAKLSIPFILLFGFYVIAHGELGPGGGFQGGVILASAYILYALMFGLEEGRRVLPRRFLEVLVAGGLFLYATVGLLGVFRERAFLDYTVLGKNPVDAEALGMTLVEWGVGITVCAVMITIYNKIADKSAMERLEFEDREAAS